MGSIPKRRFWINKPASKRVEVLGHRHFVGGTDSEAWYGIGKQQYHFLVSRGLKPSHKFLDIACGSLRLGQFLIPYLNKGCYFGFEPEAALIEAGLERELSFALAEMKAPVFSGNYDFDFSFTKSFDVALAQSLFTHLTLEDIERCFQGLRPLCKAKSEFFFTFFEGAGAKNPDGPSHANMSWHYPFEKIEKVAGTSGWKLEYIGDWGHRRKQKMVVARPSS